MNGFSPLNPSDHVLLIMDREIRKAGLPGAWCAFALELDGAPDASRLEAALSAAAATFPVLSARLTRHGRIYGWQPTGKAIPLYRRSRPGHLSSEAFWQENYLELMQGAPDAFAGPPLSFHLLEGEDRTLALVRWLHPLMDAGGVKRLFDFLVATPAQRQQFLRGEGSLVDAKLRSWPWKRRLALLWRGKRHNARIDHLESSQPTHLCQATQYSLETCHLLLSREETSQVLQNLRRRVGLGGQSLYFIACLMRALEAMGAEMEKDAWCIPYAFDLRPGNAPGPVTGNQVSVLFAQAPREVVRQRGPLFEHLRRQHADTLRHELDMAYLPLMWLGRWLSLDRYASILRLQKTGGERSSAWFSDIGEVRFATEDFFGATIRGIRHGCFVTAPPSLAVLFSRFQGRLTVSINSLRPALPQDRIEHFRALLTRELLAE